MISKSHFQGSGPRASREASRSRRSELSDTVGDLLCADDEVCMVFWNLLKSLSIAKVSSHTLILMSRKQ